jgi:hypothetical protein
MRCSAFYSLLDDCPLPDDSASSSVLVATRFHETGPNTKSMNGPVGALQEYEKGMLTLIAADSPGLQVIIVLHVSRMHNYNWISILYVFREHNYSFQRLSLIWNLVFLCAQY